jgi:hypothetical protein
VEETPRPGGVYQARMDSIAPKFVVPYQIPSYARGVPPAAGVYFLDGSCHVAGERTAFESHLVERGAVLIATVRFDGGGGEVVPPGGLLRAIDLREALARFPRVPASN